MGSSRARILAIHPVLACRDVAESMRFYASLGFVRVFQDDPQAPRYAALRRDGVELHLQWSDPGQWVEGLDRPACRFLVDDVDALHAQFARVIGTDMGGDSPWRLPADTPWGTREFHVRDPGGNSLQVVRSR